MGDPSAPRARRVPVVVEEALGATRRPDYADAFEIRAREPETRSPEQFARSALEQASPPLRSLIRSVHRHLLRFRLAPAASPDHVLGWTVVSSGPDVVHLEAQSPLLGCGMIIGRRVDATCVRVTTFLFYRRPWASRLVWAGAGPLHRRVAPYLLERAATSARQPVREPSDP